MKRSVSPACKEMDFEELSALDNSPVFNSRVGRTQGIERSDSNKGCSQIVFKALPFQSSRLSERETGNPVRFYKNVISTCKRL